MVNHFVSYFKQTAIISFCLMSLLYFYAKYKDFIQGLKFSAKDSYYSIEFVEM